jgi:hypothetical protein
MSQSFRPLQRLKSPLPLEGDMPVWTPIPPTSMKPGVPLVAAYDPASKDAQITDKHLKPRQRKMAVTKKHRDIAKRSCLLNPADKPPRKKVVEYEFD